MKILKDIRSLGVYMNERKLSRDIIGFVPTMGALHEGHLSLVTQSLRASDITIASIFVNPIQFNQPEDLNKYPRTLEADLLMLNKAKCHAVFIPEANEMYPSPPTLTLSFGRLETIQEGAFRPGHFNGVGIVVGKLFNLVQPDKSFFGQKDLQQTAIVRQLVKDLSFQTEVIVCPTVREASGLAMSSRNRRLSSEALAQAPTIYRSLQEAIKLFLNGEPVDSIQKMVNHYLSPDFKLEYVEVVNALTFEPLIAPSASGENAICIAASLEGVRLIDNIIF